MNTADAPLWADPLIQIRDLSNVDKHLAPHPVLVGLKNSAVFPALGRSRHADLPRVLVEINVDEQTPVDDGSELWRVPFRRTFLPRTPTCSWASPP